MTSFAKRFSKALKYIKHDVWNIHRTRLSRGKAFLVSLFRVLILSFRGFGEDHGYLRASSLTFYSLISIVPVAAMAFGIAKGFGFEKILEAQLRDKFAGQEDILNNVLTFSNSLLESTKGGLVAGVGLVVLFWAVVKVIGQIENSLNDIWKVKKRRSFGRTFSDYLSLMLVCPILIILSSSVTVFITTQVTLIMEKIALLGVFSSIILSILKLLPFGLLWGLFTFLYVFMPNTHVRFSSGLLAGVVAGTIFEIVQWGYITFQIGAAHYNAIYGSFAAFPLFLGWLQVSWLIVLYGAEISFAYQNIDSYEFEPDALQASHRLKTLLALLTVNHIIKHFVAGEVPPTARQLAGRFEISIRLVHEILSDLCESGIISRVDIGEEEEKGYLPARDINTMTIHRLIETMELRGINDLSMTHPPEWSDLSASLASFSEAVNRLPANKLLRDI